MIVSPLCVNTAGEELLFQVIPPSAEISNPTGGVMTTLPIRPFPKTVYNCVVDEEPRAC